MLIPRRRCEYNIEMHLKEIIRENVGYLLNMLMKYRVYKRRGIVEWLRNC
jgi:hypothetical protein